MRIARKLMLLASLALAAMAMTAGSASATSAVEILNESTNTHCGALTIGEHTVTQANPQCLVHASGNVELTTHFGFEIHVDDCTNNYDLRMDEDGNGAIYNISIVCPDADIDPCLHSGGQRHTHLGTTFGEVWRGKIEKNTATTYDINGEICIIADGIECEGDLQVPVTETGNDAAENYTTVFNDTRMGGTLCEVTGSLAQTSGTIHIN